MKPCQSDAYLVVEAEQIRVIEPVSRAIQETIKLSNVSLTMSGIISFKVEIINFSYKCIENDI